MLIFQILKISKHIMQTSNKYTKHSKRKGNY